MLLQALMQHSARLKIIACQVIVKCFHIMLLLNILITAEHQWNQRNTSSIRYRIWGILHSFHPRLDFEKSRYYRWSTFSLRSHKVDSNWILIIWLMALSCRCTSQLFMFYFVSGHGAYLDAVHQLDLMAVRRSLCLPVCSVSDNTWCWYVTWQMGCM